MSRGRARSLAVAVIAAAHALPHASRADDPVFTLAHAVSTPGVNAGVYCMWQAAQFGATLNENAAWLVARRSGFELLQWPSASGSHRSAWRGDRPIGAVAVLHTHPRADGPRPSPHDAAVARRLGLPVAVVSREGIFTALPDGTVVQDLTSAWYAAYRGLVLRSCEAPPPAEDDCARGQAVSPPTKNAAFARADGLDSWR